MRRRLAAAAVLMAMLTAPAPAQAMPRQLWLDSVGVSSPRVTMHQLGAANERRVIATSVDGRPIVARHFGALDAPVQIVVIGQMHGSEPGGRAVVQDLARLPVPRGVGLWLITTMNPDGAAADRRTNARGVDLNRNFPQGWRTDGRGGPFWSGPRAASEPETRGMVRFLSAVRPTAVISYHQAFDVVDITHPRAEAAGRLLAGWMGEQARKVPCSGPCHGTLTQWADGILETIALTVELDHRVSGREAHRAATAVLRLGRWLGR